MELQLNTDRLYLRNICLDDSTFLLELINSPGWLEFIGDKKITTEEACKEWIDSVVLKQLRDLGFTTMVIFRKEDNLPIGVVSLVKRDYLDYLDIGYALLPEFVGSGYAFEATKAGLVYAKGDLNSLYVYAIVQDNNIRSKNLLDRLNFIYEGTVDGGGEVLLKYRDR